MTFNNENYQLKCKNTIDNFIKNATRLEKFAFNIDTIETFELHYKISLNIRISFRTEKTSQLGKLTNSHNNIVYNTQAAYNSALEALIAKETTTSDNLTLTKNKILDHPFGILHTITDLKTCSEKISYCHKCEKCKGEGEKKCDDCMGIGQCTCRYCKGSGFIQESKTLDVNYGPKELRGYRTESVNVTCHYCNGQGNSRCENCLGSGKTTCESCNAEGYITDTTTVIITAIPQYTLIFDQDDTPNFIYEAFDHYGTYRLDEVGSVNYTDYQQTDNSTLLFNYNASCPFARFKSLIQNRDIFWIIFGESPIIFESSNAIEILLEKDLYELEETAVTSHLLKPNIFSRCQPSILKFTESEINQELINLADNNQSFEKTRNQLNRAVSINYIEIANKSLDNISKAISYWSSLKWILATFAIIILYSNISVLFNLLPYEIDKLAQGNATSIPGFYDDLYRSDGTLPLWEAIGKLANHMLIPILIFSFLFPLLRVYWLRIKIKEKMPYLYIWMDKKGMLPLKWPQMGITITIASCFLIEHVTLPIYFGNVLGIIPVHMFL